MKQTLATLTRALPALLVAGLIACGSESEPDKIVAMRATDRRPL